ncbi:hypothetical protein JTE90_022737 [Oedothorax gibbosus]|uniref:Uncharacterized protein n=1 Tax=Oedothorax gibbosus TaxID=931172 RepID=A0AAV6UPN1_9ARAC|nr:hypothetical protein JTE90_022737 [Oedothorax gibbosus]
MSKRTFEEASKAMEMSSRAESNMTLANLPQNMIHLGDSQFLVFVSEKPDPIRRSIPKSPFLFGTTINNATISPYLAGYRSLWAARNETRRATVSEARKEKILGKSISRSEKV